ncbi:MULTISPECIES: aminotransferase class III-fold pyridoxal phosphate-dependent enzyme [unclassified Caballeronia]|uniref:aspartate aminotransferase family protein n=1 Tax=unclassified Caballeronia TaxID=2646786 RepID=UPI002855A0C3|nr:MULTISPECIES: aminotransferase class III-fold pyridoxal phosphate-dependent enzyme [unclassified Caballeronia]MDR5771158.1 aminotransferase class III-fold pyridoxal phosphate-dependent enzyme [Caballeronia sp. LZ002]MDR5801524.1 aminotransferase class III-fold pyridoxal phosphate-dependent enzyme [Caballeronia sp. LZ001]MDR5846595.1 aminotransferase class III-fold pyridoxal phosphate-dependent enzyme [Caballeronia sp. LZ003]
MSLTLEVSHQLFRRACKSIPGGVSSNNRANWHPFPLFYSYGKGAYIWDVDGNQYIDFVLGRGPLILGHSCEPVVAAIERQARKGQLFAGQTLAEIELAELISELVPGAVQSRFCNSGSEAVHAALRLARAATGRTEVIRFAGHYHGWYDNISWGFKGMDTEGIASKPLALSEGQPLCDRENISCLQWNDLRSLEATINERGARIAAVITEPIMFNGYCSNILPLPGFLQGMRELCRRHGILLIFDEVQTGFRTHIGGAQSYFGVRPDISVFGKAMSGGASLACVSAAETLMSSFALGKCIHSGTSNASPIAISAALAHLRTLSDVSARYLSIVHELSNVLATGLSSMATMYGGAMQVRSSPGAVTTTFRTHVDQPKDHISATHNLSEATLRRWHAALQQEGVRITPEGLWYVSAAHSMEDIERALQKAQKVLPTVITAARQR